MTLPRAVLEAEQRADELLKQLTEAKGQQTPEVETVANGQQTEQVQAQEATPAEPTEQSQAIAAPLAEEDPSWEQRYRSLVGKYNAEVPRLVAGNRELTSKLQSMEQEIEAIKAAKETPRESLVKPEEVQEFGEPLVDLIRRAARDEVSGKEAEIASLRAKLDRFEATTTKTAEIDFYERLANAVPEWEEINKADGFLKWLGEYDELTGLERQSSLDDAVRMQDASRAARFFNKWKDITKTQAATSSRSLESQVVPDTVTSTAAPVGKKI